MFRWGITYAGIKYHSESRLFNMSETSPESPESDAIQTQEEGQLQEDSPAATSGASSGEPPILLIVDRLADRAEPLIEIFKAFAERSAQSQATKVKFRIGMTIVAVVTVLSLVGAATFLTYVGQIEGSTFGFLLGLIIGYMLTFIRDAIGPTSTDEF
jgi:hypothetical protein